MARFDQPLGPPAHLGGEGEEGVERPVVDGDVLDLTGVVLAEDCYSADRGATACPRFPFDVSSRAVLRLMGEHQHLVDAAGRCHRGLDGLATGEWFAKGASLENDAAGEGLAGWGFGVGGGGPVH